MDARTARTAEALRTAILELASREHVDKLGVAQVAAEAGIHRVTFYDHARSPAELLARVMREELDEVRARYLASSYVREHTAADAIRGTSVAVAALVDSHGAIFEHLLAAPSRTTPQHLLAPHFERSVSELLADRSWSVPPGVVDPTLPREEFDAALARFIAYGCVGVIEVWLVSEPAGARDPERYYRMLEPLLPRWLFGS